MPNELPRVHTGQQQAHEFDDDLSSMAAMESFVSCSSFMRVILFVGLATIMLMATISNYSMYISFTESHPHHRVFCVIPLRENITMPCTFEHPMQYNLNWFSFWACLPDSNRDNFNKPSYYFSEQIDIDFKDNEFSLDINVVDYPECKQGRFYHDFRRNLTLLVDEKQDYCYVLPLRYDLIASPAKMFGIIRSMGVCNTRLNTTQIDTTYQIINPIIVDLWAISPRFAFECINKTQFFLQTMPPEIKLNSRKYIVSKYAEFAGHGIILYHIVQPTHMYLN